MNVGGSEITAPQIGEDRVNADTLEIIELRWRCHALQQENDALRAAMKELERVAERDTLTPLYNRRHFLASIKKRLLELDVGAERGAVVFMDVNQLKAINDRYGHAAGDSALVEIAARVNSHIHSGEVAARIGGDEFGLILDVADLVGAERRVNEIRSTLQSSKAEFEGVEISLSACFGTAMLRGGESGVSILALADREMYSAKYRKTDPTDLAAAMI